MGRLAFAAYTKELRENADLTQAEVAKSLKLSTAQMVSNWERGLCYPPLVLIIPLSKLYKISLEELFEVYSTAVKDDLWNKIKRGKKRLG